MIDATVLCKTTEERDAIIQQLKQLNGVVFQPSQFAIAISYDKPDTATDTEIAHTTARLFDIVESVETHGIVIS